MHKNSDHRGYDPWEKGSPIEKNQYNWTGDPYILTRKQGRTGSRFTHVDLFSGCGGFAQGFKWAGFEQILGVDIHTPSAETFQLNHPEANMIVGDIREVPDEMFLEALEGQSVDVVTAGVPCQGFSLNNRKRWEMDERNFLFREFIRVVKLVMPKIVLLENVSGLCSAGDGQFKRDIAAAIEECGYKVDFRILNAADYGVPQQRRRIFFFGVLPEMEIVWPAGTHGDAAGAPYLTVWDAIGDLPPLQAGESESAYTTVPQTDYQRFMRGDCATLLNHEAPHHSRALIERIGSTKPGEPIYPGYAQRIRLHPDRPSPTLVSGGI